MPEFRNPDNSDLESLTKDEWEELYLRLRYFAFKFYSHLAKNDTILEDLIHESYIDACRAKRKRPPSVSHFNFICGIMRSKTSHYFEKEKRRARLNTATKVTRVMSAKEVAEYENARLDLSSAMQRVEKEIKDDKALNIIHQSVLIDPEIKPARIARDNNLPVNLVKNARRRYFRLVRKALTA